MNDTLPGLSALDALATLTPADADRFRFVITPDEQADGPLQWGGVTAIRTDGTSRAWSNGTPTGGADPIDLERARDAFADRLPNNGAIAEACIRWARIFHGTEVQRWDVSLDQSTWVDALVYLEEDATDGAALTGTLDTLTAWGRGEVYGVRLERAHDFDADLFEWTGWEVLEDADLWGNYLDRDYTPADVAVDNFGVPRAFAEAVAVVDSYDA